MSVLFKSETSPEEQIFYDQVFCFLKEASVTCFERMIVGIKNVEVKDIPQDESFHYDHWTCSTEIKLSYATVGIKLHYRTSTARCLAAQRLGLDAFSLPTELLRDMIQEYLNLMMGLVKRKLRSVDLGVAIPETAPTGDLDDPRLVLVDRNGITWRLSWPEDSVYFSCFVKLERGINQIPDLKVLEGSKSNSTDAPSKGADDEESELEIF